MEAGRKRMMRLPCNWTTSFPFQGATRTAGISLHENDTLACRLSCCLYPSQRKSYRTAGRHRLFEQGPPAPAAAAGHNSNAVAVAVQAAEVAMAVPEAAAVAVTVPEAAAVAVVVAVPEATAVPAAAVVSEAAAAAVASMAG